MIKNSETTLLPPLPSYVYQQYWTRGPAQAPDTLRIPPAVRPDADNLGIDQSGILGGISLSEKIYIHRCVRECAPM
jgi:hypothetical protein